MVAKRFPNRPVGNPAFDSHWSTNHPSPPLLPVGIFPVIQLSDNHPSSDPRFWEHLPPPRHSSANHGNKGAPPEIDSEAQPIHHPPTGKIAVLIWLGRTSCAIHLAGSLADISSHRAYFVPPEIAKYMPYMIFVPLTHWPIYHLNYAVHDVPARPKTTATSN